MKPQVTSAIFLLMIVGLFIANGVLTVALRKAQQRESFAIQKLKEAPAILKGQAEQFVRGVQANASVRFSEIVSNMRLANQMSVESEQKVAALLGQRESYLSAIKNEASLSEKLKLALTAIEFDNEVITTFGDVLNLQTMHRQRIIEHLEPLAKELGITTE